jgi:hypothetical protein
VGVNITDGDEIKVFLKDTPSKQTIHYLTVSSKQDLTPTGVYHKFNENEERRKGMEKKGL